MSQTVKCWFDEDPDGAEDVDAYDARSAAEVFAEENWDPCDRGDVAYDVRTRDSFGVERRFKVHVASEPVFSATEVK